jgi:hypothetical protein
MLMNRSTGHPPKTSINPDLVNLMHDSPHQVWRFIQLYALAVTRFLSNS